MHVALALVAASGWGASTMLAGRAARRGSVVSVTFWSQFLGFLVASPVLVLAGASSATGHALGAGAIAGVGVGASLYLLYLSTRFLFVGVASALSAVVACAGPVVYSAFGHPLGAQAVAGLAVCLAAILVVGRWRPPARRGTPSSDHRRELVGALIALASGLGLAVYYVALAGTSVHAQLWEALDSRFVSAAVVAAAVLCTTGRLALGSMAEVKAAAPVALVGIVAALAYASSVSASSLAVIVPIASLSPVVTVLLGWLVLDERVSHLQLAGLVLAMLGVVLVTAR